MASENVVNIDNAQVAYRVQGKGPAVVLVNGTGALDGHWGHVIEVLSSQRTVISLDYSGSGDTVDDGGMLTLEKLARQVVGVAKAAGAETFDLIGYSLGSVIATFVAAEKYQGSSASARKPYSGTLHLSRLRAHYAHSGERAWPA